MNESFAVISGLAMNLLGVNPDWNIGERCNGISKYFVPMSNQMQERRSQPDTYNGQYWVNPSNLQNDNGGFHINSGVQNFVLSACQRKRN
jgi:Zn-dependent metalloprotease